MKPNANGPVYLIASSQKKTLDALLARAAAGVGGRPARVAASYAAAEGHGGQMSALLEKAFGGAEVTRFAVHGERGAMAPSKARAIVEQADVIFLGGGDPVHGAKLLTAAGADQWLRDARARGASCMGISAGAMMLCAFWAEWPDEPDEGARHDGGSLVPGAAVVPDLVIDCHAEGDGWSELKLVRGMLLDRFGKAATAKIRVVGVPAGGGLIVSPDGALESVGLPPFHLHEAS